MKDSFNPISYSLDVAKELVAAFDVASNATTPCLVGGARELTVRKKLEHLLPSGLAVGSGCIIDSFGRTSKQQDIVIYEKELCPVFSVNETPETTYYPCEGVIAVVEVKSSIGKKELIDIFKKSKSVKTLVRFTRECRHKIP